MIYKALPGVTQSLRSITGSQHPILGNPEMRWFFEPHIFGPSSQSSYKGHAMFMLKRISQVVAAAMLLPLLCAAQQQESRSQISLGVTGNFSRQSEGNEVIQDPTQSAGFVASYRHIFTPKVTLELTYAFTRNTQNFTLTGPVFAPIQTDIHETTAAYVFAPQRTGRLKPFLLGGGGALIFSPTSTFNNTAFGANTQTRPTAVFGGGAEYKLFGQVALRLQYRGLFYKAPDFGVSTFTTGSWGLMSEPSAGLAFNF
jgi:opacity protein-like surface antigen